VLLPPARMLRFEVVTVVLVALLPSAVVSLYDFVKRVFGDRSPVRTRITIGIPGHTAVDVVLQVALLAAETVAVLLVVYVLARSGESLRTIGLRRERWGRDLGLAIGLTLAALVVASITLVALGSLRLHVERTPGVGAAYIPVALMHAVRAGLLEEIVVCGYLLHRLRQLGWTDGSALFVSVAVRGSYHLYGGIPLVALSILFGLAVGRIYQRTNRLTAIVLTHVLYDAILLTAALFSH